MRRLDFRIFTASVLTIIVLFLISSTTNAQTTPAEVGVFEPFQVSPGSTIQVPVSIRGVKELYGVDFTLEFDSNLLQVVDADPVMEGVQAGLGDFLDPGLLLFNIVDNQAGTIRFTMAQYNPSEAKSGSGNLVVVTFEGVALGESPLEISAVSLATREGEEIESIGVSGSLVVSQDASTQAVTYTVLKQPTGLMVIKTETPAPVLTPSPSATLTSIISITEQVDEMNSNAEETEEINVREQGTDVPFLVSNWWLLLVMLLVVITIGILGFTKITRDSKGSKK